MLVAHGIKKRSVALAVGKLPNLVPSLLQLPLKVQERVVVSPLVAELLDAKLADRPLALLVVYGDLFLVIMLLVLVLLAAKRLQGDAMLQQEDRLLLAVISCIDVYFFSRELFQARTMSSLKLFGQYFHNRWNIIDWLALSFTAALVISGASGSYVRDSIGFRCLGAFTTSLLWLKVVGAIKVFSVKLATFVYSLSIIMTDILDFALILVMMMLMFAGMFHLLLFKTVKEFGDDDDLGGDVPRQAWGTVSNSIITIISFVLSEADRDMFASELYPESLAVLATLIFVVFISFVVIVMLNVLIAVVSDSYDYAMTRATQLFLRTRLQLVAELDSLGLTEEDALPPEATKALAQSTLMRIMQASLRLKTRGAKYQEDSWVGRVLHVEKTMGEGVRKLVEHLEGDRMHFEGAVDTLERAIAKQIRRTNDEMVATTRKIVAEVLEEERKKVERQEESKKFMKQHELQRQQDQRDQALIQKITMALKK